MSLLIRLVLLSAAIALATIAFGWWAVPVVAAVWGVVARHQRGSALADGLASVVAWAGLLGADAARGPVGALAATLGGILGTNAIGVYAITLALPGLLGVTAAIVGRGIAARRSS